VRLLLEEHGYLVYKRANSGTPAISLPVKATDTRIFLLLVEGLPILNESVLQLSRAFLFEGL